MLVLLNCETAATVSIIIDTADTSDIVAAAVAYIIVS